MRGFRASAILAVAVSWLAGCAAPQIPFDRASVGDIKTIGIVTPSFPDSSDVVLASTVGQSFGLVGLMIDTGMKANRDSQFNALLQQRSFSERDVFLESLTGTLQANGYSVATVPATREKKDFLAHYPTGTVPAVDAYLDLVVNGYGYVAAGIGSSTPYRPGISVRARLVSARDSSVLMQNLVVYNPINAADKAVTVAPDPAYQFKDFDALIAEPDKAVAGLRTAAERTAETISALLK
jgi:hypothetical protein